MNSPDLDLLQGTLNVLVLRALSWHAMHGYAVARFIRDGSGERFRILDGALWPAGIAAGIVFALLLIRTRRIGESVAAHALLNALLSVAVLLGHQWQLW